MPAVISFSPYALQRLRLERGLNYTLLAAATGVTEDAIKGYESGRFAPSARVLGALAVALDCSVADLFTDRLGRGEVA